MPQMARAKMFDDISSFSEDDSVQHELNVPPVARSAQHVDPAMYGASTCEGAADRGIFSDDNPSVFVPSSAYAPHQLAKPEVTGEEDAGQVTMVTCVRVSLSPKKSPLSTALSTHLALAPAQVQSPAASLLVQQQPESAPAGTPATLSQQSAWREEVEVAVNLHQAGSGIECARKAHRHSYRAGAYDSDLKDRDDGAATSGAKDAAPEQYPGQQGKEVVGYSTTRNCEDSYSTRYRHDKSDGWETHEQYTPASMNRVSAAPIEYSDEEYAAHFSAPAHHLQNSKIDHEDFPLASYIFPRLNPALAGNQGSRTVLEQAKTPNVIERSCAYLMVADIRVVSYLAALFLAVMLVTVSIPTSQLDVVGGACFTYWGFKDNCDNATYTITQPVYPCALIRDHLGVGAAFSIITLIVYLVNLAAVVIVVCCLTKSPHTISSKSRILVGVLGCLGAVAQVISWAVVARIYNFHPCVEGELAYGVGFGLNLSSWVINLLGATLVLVHPSGTLKQHQQHP